MRADAEGQTALRLRQGAQRAEKLDRAVPGRFVTGMERQEAQREAKACGVLASFDGGWDDAERVQVCFHPDGVDAEFTAVWLEISWAAKFARVGHSDLLGSLMALGMDRSLFGDLMVEDGTAYLLAMPEAAKSLQDEWHEAGTRRFACACWTRRRSSRRRKGRKCATRWRPCGWTACWRRACRFRGRARRKSSGRDLYSGITRRKSALIPCWKRAICYPSAGLGAFG